MKKANLHRVSVWLLIFPLSILCVATTFSATAKHNASIANENTTLVSLTESEILMHFDSFLSQQPSTLTEAEKFSTETLTLFIQYAVDNNIIEDTLEQRAALSKATLRAQFTLVATVGNEAGLYTAAALLNHSLQDAPPTFAKDSTTGYALQILNSADCQSLIDDYKEYLIENNLSAASTSGSLTLNCTPDLFLAYNKVNYVITANKSSGVWTLLIRFTDVYDFQEEAWKEEMNAYSAAVNIINNYAASAQAQGAIVPYDIKITVRTTFSA